MEPLYLLIAAALASFFLLILNFKILPGYYNRKNNLRNSNSEVISAEEAEKGVEAQLKPTTFEKKNCSISLNDVDRRGLVIELGTSGLKAILTVKDCQKVEHGITFFAKGDVVDKNGKIIDRFREKVNYYRHADFLLHKNGLYKITGNVEEDTINLKIAA